MANAVVLPCPDRGMNAASSQLAGSSRSAQRLVNFLPGFDRRVVLRGPIWNQYPSGTSTDRIPSIVYNEGRKRTLFYDTGTTATVREDDLSSTGTQTALSSSTTFQPGERASNLRGRTYGRVNNTATLPTSWQTRGYGISLPTWLVMWDGTTTTPTGVSNGPVGIVDQITHLDRLFVLGGGTPGSGITTAWDEVIYWSDIGGPVTNTAAEWQDDATGLTNVINLGNEGGNLIGFGHVNRNLCIFRDNGIQVVYGSTPSAFELRMVMRNVGCIGKTSICDYNDGVVFMDRNGVVQFFDGNSLQAMSGPVQQSFTYLATRVRALTNAVSIQRLGTEHIVVSMTWRGGGGDNEGFSYVCHMPTGAWFQLTTNSALYASTYSNGPTFNFAVGGRTLGWGSTAGYFLEDIITPWRHAQYASTTLAARMGRDYSGSSYFYIPGAIEWPVQKISTPFSSAKIDRFALDYTNLCLSTESPSSGGLKVSIGTRLNQDEITNGTLLDTGYETFAGASSNVLPYPTGRMNYAVWDTMAEGRDFIVTVTTPTGAANSINAPKYIDVGNAYLEVQQTNPRGNVRS